MHKMHKMHQLINFDEWFGRKICRNNTAKSQMYLENIPTEAKYCDFIDWGIAQIFKADESNTQ